MGEKVYVENFPTKNPRWISGIIVKVTGPLSYQVELRNRARVRRHVGNVRRREEKERENSNQELHPPMLLGPELLNESEAVETAENKTENSDTGNSAEPQASEQNTAPHHSNRARNPPERYEH